MEELKKLEEEFNKFIIQFYDVANNVALEDNCSPNYPEQQTLVITEEDINGEIWSWIEQKIKEAKISENEYWRERLDLVRFSNSEDCQSTIWGSDFTERIKELKGE